VDLDHLRTPPPVSSEAPPSADDVAGDAALGQVAGAGDSVAGDADLETAAARGEAILATALDAIVMMDAGGHITEFNAAAERIFGYRRADVLGQPVADHLIPASLREQHRLGIERYLATGEGLILGRRVETTALRADGDEFPIELAVSRIPGDGPPQFVAYIRDLTERRELEERLRAAEWEALARARQVEAVLEAVPDPLSIHDATGRIVRLNAAGQRVAGEGRGHEALADLPNVYDLRTPQGEPFPLDEQPVARALRGETVVAAEMHPYGLQEQPQAILVSAAPLRDAEGRVEGAVTVTHDITPLRTAERETARRMDEFLGIASHELRTPLTAIKAILQTAQRRLDREQAQAQHLRRKRANGQPSSAAAVAELLEWLAPMLERSARQSDRLAHLIGDLLDTSRIHAGQLELDRGAADLVAIVRDAVEEQRMAAPARTITLTLAHDGDTLPVHVDANRIGQVVANYLTNALKYSRAEEPVDVSVRRDGEAARVAVRDRGLGLTAEQQAHLGERFYRAEGVEVQSGSGIGLGLGLYISRSIVERHGGAVGVESTPGEGSTFSFTLPLA
jgi:PAS domain S-box-containing protein